MTDPIVVENDETEAIFEVEQEKPATQKDSVDPDDGLEIETPPEEETPGGESDPTDMPAEGADPAREGEIEGAPAKPAEEPAPATAPEKPPVPSTESPTFSRDFFKAVTEQAKQAVTKLTGEEFDEFNAEHQVILTAAASEIVTNAKQQKVRNDHLQIINQQIDQILPNEEAWKVHEARLGDLPNKVVREIQRQTELGNFEPLLKLVRESATEFGKRKQASDKAAKIGKAAGKTVFTEDPVPLMGGGSPRSTGKKSDDGEDSAGPEYFGF